MPLNENRLQLLFYLEVPKSLIYIGRSLCLHELVVKMDIHFPLLLSIITISSFLLTTLPLSHGVEDEHYRACNTTYNCGNLTSISYPFWGMNRPSYCGINDTFELICDQYGDTSIQIESQNYMVLWINQSTFTMRLETSNYVRPSCSPQTEQNGTVSQSCYASRTSVMYVTPIVQSDRQYSGGFPRCEECNASGGMCGSGISNTSQFSCHCQDGSEDLTCSNPDNGNPPTFAGSPPIVIDPVTKGNPKIKVIIAIISGIVGAVLICIAICCLTSKRMRKYWGKNDDDTEAFIRKHKAQALQGYKYSQVRKMTNSFQEPLGEGGFGSVYKGELPTGCSVAVKMLKRSKGNNKDFINEVDSISRTSHVNIVTLLGYCLEGSKKALIYEYMPNGSLEKFIYKKEAEANPVLSWEILHRIAVGVARGLEYLHRGCNTKILHFDIKPHNILLDENFCPKISDFGLAMLCHSRESNIAMADERGTPAYRAPEVRNTNLGGASHRSDVYSYGMMLLEMVGGRKNLDAEVSRPSEIYYPHWVYNNLEMGNTVVLEGVTTTEESEVAKKMILVGLWCIQTIPMDRPAISQVIEMLEGSIDSLQMPPKPSMS